MSVNCMLNKRGKIYHLDLHPDELMGDIILVGDPHRVPLVSKHFDEIIHVNHNREFCTHVGRIGQSYFSVVSTGIGADNIDIAINELDALVNIDFSTRLPKECVKKLRFIRLGTAGALQSNLEPGSMLISKYAVGLDALLSFYQYKESPDELSLKCKVASCLDDMPIKQLMYVSSSASNLFDQLSPLGHAGITVTCCGFYGPQNRVLRLPLAHVGWLKKMLEVSHHDYLVSNFEMETASTYALASLLGHEACSVSALVVNRETQAVDQDMAGTVDRMIMSTLECLTSSLVDNCL